MTIQRIGLRPEKSPLYNKAVIHGGVAYLAGQVAVNPAPTAAEQTRQILAQIDDYLSQCGTDKSRLLTATVLFADMRDYAAVNEVWDAWVVPGSIPTRTAFEAKLVTQHNLVAIQVSAAMP
ncbi:MAG: RidA family protein [Bosea sp.]|uniref:RidA family protein n=1 Tax=Bosea sp. (in: a-proteobacteria) TaxID=1871050 RepID=UPI001AC441DE|nr:RidA family protein [Bosea sp. (in: a-proteobacteria)]MBN9454331.1 RidA family protein [Bosea sp. (in: a-proteobacteria)]